MGDLYREWGIYAGKRHIYAEKGHIYAKNRHIYEVLGLNTGIFTVVLT